ncbi:hypothetical protein K438DRAFT_1989880 [Mycena galopus ATCC 62051]|nr:hypothetical protein K438DRAFT_1989880 [Mycena galopus ATCC 62051]
MESIGSTSTDNRAVVCAVAGGGAQRGELLGVDDANLSHPQTTSTAPPCPRSPPSYTSSSFSFTTDHRVPRGLASSAPKRNAAQYWSAKLASSTGTSSGRRAWLPPKIAGNPMRQVDGAQLRAYVSIEEAQGKGISTYSSFLGGHNGYSSSSPPTRDSPPPVRNNARGHPSLRTHARPSPAARDDEVAPCPRRRASRLEERYGTSVSTIRMHCSTSPALLKLSLSPRSEGRRARGACDGKRRVKQAARSTTLSIATNRPHRAGHLLLPSART